MKKNIAKIAGLSLGFAMALGVGVGVNNVISVSAANDKVDIDVSNLSSSANCTVNGTAGVKANKGAQIDITIPKEAGSTDVYFYIAAWNKEGVAHNVTYTNATSDLSSLTLTADAGVSGSSTAYTLSTNEESTYLTHISLNQTDSSADMKITIAGVTDKRMVAWGAYYIASSSELVSVSFTGDMTNKTYYEGDSWDYTGLSLQANYEDVSTKTLGTVNDLIASNELEITPDPVNPMMGITSLVVTGTYGELAVDAYTINDIEVNEARTLKSIELHGELLNSTYYEDDEWNLDGLDLQLNYSIGDPQYISLDDEGVEVNVTPNEVKVGVRQISVSAKYAGLTSEAATYDVTVNEAPYISTYEVKSATSVDIISKRHIDATVSFESTNSQNKLQVTSKTSMTLTLSNLKNTVAIKSLVMSMKSNAKAGAGSVTLTMDGVDNTVQEDSNFNTFGDNTEYTTTYKDVTWTFATPLEASSEIILKIVGSTNSIYIEKISFEYEEKGGNVITELSVNPDTKTYYDSEVVDLSEFEINVTKNGEEGSTSDVEFVGIGTGTGDSFIAREGFVDGEHPLTSDTTLQWKAKYPTTSGGSEYLYAEVALTVRADSLESLTLSGDMIQKNYLTGDKWNAAGLSVLATYSSGTTSDVTSDVTWEFNPETIDSVEITSVEVTASYLSVKSNTLTISDIVVETYTGYNLVNNLSDLKTGDKVVVAATKNDSSYIMTNDNAGSYFASESIDVINDSIASNKVNNAYVFEIEFDADNKLALKNNDKYVTISSSANSATLSNDAAYYNVEIDEGLFKLSIDGTGSDEGSSRYLMYNSSSPRFASYKGNMTFPSIYKYSGIEAEISSIAIKGELEKTTYYEGEDWDLSGLSLEVVYDNGDKVTVTSGVEYTTDPVKPTADVTMVNITASYENKVSAMVRFVVSVKPLPSHASITFPEGNWKIDDMLYVSDVESVTSGHDEKATGSATNFEENSIKLGTGSKVGSFIVGLKTKSNLIVRIDITARRWDSSTNLLVGDETINLTNELAKYTVTLNNVSSIKIATSAKRAFITAIDVYYEANENAPTPTSLAISGAKTSFTEGDAFDLGKDVVITLTYSDGDTRKVGVDELTFKNKSGDVLLINQALATADNGVVTVSYTEGEITVSATYEIEVKEKETPVPGPGDDSSSTTSETTSTPTTSTSIPSTSTTSEVTPSTSDSSKKNNGCGGSITAISSVSVLSLAGLIVLTIKKRKNK